MGSPRISILTVCTANICRSPFAATRLATSVGGALAEHGLDLEIKSAGIATRPGSPPCPSLWSAAGMDVPEGHRSQPATPELLSGSRLVLGLASNHTSALASLAPGARTRTFTLEDAAALASAVAGPRHALYWAQADQSEIATLDPLDPLTRVPNLPAGADERFDWLIAEMDAWRGTVPRISTGSVDDPHESEVEIHSEVSSEISGLAVLLGSSVAAVLSA